MPSKPSILARLFGRSQNSVVSKLHTHALNTPLLLHPTIGAQLIGAYLDGAVDAPVTVAESAGVVAVINISGALVNRPMPDICGDGPVSYVAIRNALDAALGDSNVAAIILRMDTPGGMASGCFDLTDYIHAARGNKPIVAQIDDMACSAGYAIAAACDSVQVTRTGVGGSIGVYRFHADWSGANAKDGVKVTYIFAGAHKVDSNPDEPLSDSARKAAQENVDMHYAMFTSAVSNYRGIPVEQVIATEAACYTGADLVAAGLADSVGTLEDLVAKLSVSAAQEDSKMPDAITTPAAEAAAPPAVAETPTPAALAAAAQISEGEKLTAFVTAVTGSKLPSAVQVALIKRGHKDESPEAAVANASAIRDVCAAAKLESCAADYVAAGTNIEQVRKDLAAAVADTGKNEVVTISQPAAKSGKWDSTVAKFGGK